MESIPRDIFMRFEMTPVVKSFYIDIMRTAHFLNMTNQFRILQDSGVKLFTRTFPLFMFLKIQAYQDCCCLNMILSILG